MPKVVLGVKLFTADELADLLGVGHQTARKYISEGRIEAQTIGGKKFVSEESIKRFLKN